jgi:hypothetical protein
MHDAAVLMGFRPTVRIAKTRRTASVGGIELCVHDVEAAGGFIELEPLAPDYANALTIQSELAAFADSLGISAVRVTDTYDSIVHDAQTDSSEQEREGNLRLGRRTHASPPAMRRSPAGRQAAARAGTTA